MANKGFFIYRIKPLDPGCLDINDTKLHFGQQYGRLECEAWVLQFIINIHETDTSMRRPAPGLELQRRSTVASA
jgi:hypothetical protein